MSNEHGYTVQYLRKMIPLTIEAEAQPIQFGPEWLVGRVPKDHARQVEEAKRTLSMILDRINSGANQAYVDAVAETIYSCEVCIFYIHSSCGYTEADML